MKLLSLRVDSAPERRLGRPVWDFGAALAMVSSSCSGEPAGLPQGGEGVGGRTCGLIRSLHINHLTFRRIVMTLHMCDAIIEESECGKNTVYTLKNAA